MPRKFKPKMQVVDHDDEDRKPWQRLADESDVAFQAFEAYRIQQVPRSSARLATALGKSESLLRAWSSHHSWVQRVRAWDDHVQKEACDAELAVIRDMHKRHARQSHEIMEVMMAPIRAYYERFKKDPAFVLKLEDLTVKELLKLTAETARVYPNLARTESLAMGEATEIVKNEHSVDAKSVRSVQITVVGGRDSNPSEAAETEEE
ncbi:MAG: hypothetical protein JSS89_13255 [Bacteroidetes bacterium]|nr:hypothetical protein [Bacteroidota bacterium]